MTHYNNELYQRTYIHFNEMMTSEKIRLFFTLPIDIIYRILDNLDELRVSGKTTDLDICSLLMHQMLTCWR